MRNKLSIYCGFISLSFSLITLALFFVKVKASSVVDISTFIGVMGAFIGISVTLLIGYQIFNVLDFRNKLSQLESLKKNLNTRERGNQFHKFTTTGRIQYYPRKVISQRLSPDS